MRRLVLCAVLATVGGCASSRAPYAAGDVPQGYLDALARERGVSQEQARQILLESRSKPVPDRVADATSRVTSRGVSAPSNPHPAGQAPR